MGVYIIIGLVFGVFDGSKLVLFLNFGVEVVIRDGLYWVRGVFK